MPLAAGTRLAHFQVTALVGAGGMGEVYRAHDLDLGRDVALKVLPDEVVHDPERLARFDREARAAAALNHPNVLAVYEVGSGHHPPFVAFELLSGHTLRLMLDRPLGLGRALDFATQAAKGLGAAHDKGIVHRDIKPENLFITTDGALKILDFGIAKRADDGSQRREGASTLTAPGAVLGTCGYMAPEQVRGEAIDARADVFALGAVVFEMLTARPAFSGGNPTELFAAVLKDDPPRITDLNPATPPGVARIVHRCLEKRREERYQSARDVAFALEAVAEAVPERPEPWWRRRAVVGAQVPWLDWPCVAGARTPRLRSRRYAA
jgi:serine/threonine protein kinase